MRCASRSSVNAARSRSKSECSASSESRSSSSRTVNTDRRASLSLSMQSMHEGADLWPVATFTEEAATGGFRFTLTLLASEQGGDAVAHSDGTDEAARRRTATTRWRLLSYVLSNAASGTLSVRSCTPAVFTLSTLPHTIRLFTVIMPARWPAAPHALMSRPEAGGHRDDGVQQERLAELLRWLPPLQHHIQSRCRARQERRQRRKKVPHDGIDEVHDEASWVTSKVVAALSHALSNLADLLKPLGSAHTPLAIAVTAATVVPVTATPSSISSAATAEVCSGKASTESQLHIRCTLLEVSEGETGEAVEASVGEDALADAWSSMVSAYASSLPPVRDDGTASKETVLKTRLRTYAQATAAQLPLFADDTVRVRGASTVAAADITSFLSSSSSSGCTSPPHAGQTDPLYQDDSVPWTAQSQRTRRSLRLQTLNAIVRQEAPTLTAQQTYLCTCLALIAELTSFQRHYVGPARGPAAAAHASAKRTPYLESEIAYLTELLCFYASAVRELGGCVSHGTDDGSQPSDSSVTEAHVKLWLRTHLLGTAETSSVPSSLMPLYADLFPSSAARTASSASSPLAFHDFMANWRHWLILRVVSAAVDWTSLWMSASVRAMVPCGTENSATAKASAAEVYRVRDVCHQQFRFVGNGIEHTAVPRMTRTRSGFESASLAPLTARAWCRQVQAQRDDGDAIDSFAATAGGATELAQSLWGALSVHFPTLNRASRALLHFFQSCHARLGGPCNGNSVAVPAVAPVWYTAMRRAVVAPSESSVFHSSNSSRSGVISCTVLFTTPVHAPSGATVLLPLSAPARRSAPSQPLDRLDTSVEELSCSLSPTLSGASSPVTPRLLSRESTTDAMVAGHHTRDDHRQRRLPALCRWRYRDFLRVFASVLMYQTHYAEADRDANGDPRRREDSHAAIARAALAPAERLQLPLLRCIVLCSSARVSFQVCPDSAAAEVVTATLKAPCVLIDVARGEVLVPHVSALHALITATVWCSSRLMARGVVAIQSFLRAKSGQRWHVSVLQRAAGTARLDVVRRFVLARLSVRHVELARQAALRTQTPPGYHTDEAVLPARKPSGEPPLFGWSQRSRLRFASPSFSPSIAVSVSPRPTPPSPPRLPPVIPIPSGEVSSHAATAALSPPSPPSAAGSAEAAAKSPLAAVLRTLGRLEGEGRYWIEQEMQLVWREFLAGWEQLQRVGVHREEAEAHHDMTDALWAARQHACLPTHTAPVVPPLADASSPVSLSDSEERLDTPELLRTALELARYGTRHSERSIQKGTVDSRSDSAPRVHGAQADEPKAESVPTEHIRTSDLEELVVMERAARAELWRRYADAGRLIAHHYLLPVVRETLVEAERIARGRLMAVEGLCREELQHRWGVIEFPCLTAAELLHERYTAASAHLSDAPSHPATYVNVVASARGAAVTARRARQRVRGTTLLERPEDLPVPSRSADDTTATFFQESQVLHATDFALSTPGPSILSRCGGGTPPRTTPATSTRAGSVPVEEVGGKQVEEASSRAYAASPPPPRTVPVVALSLRHSAASTPPSVFSVPRARLSYSDRRSVMRTLLPDDETERESSPLGTRPAAPAATRPALPSGLRADEYERLKAAVEGSPDGTNTRYRAAQATTAAADDDEEATVAVEKLGRRPHVPLLPSRWATVPQLSTAALMDREATETTQLTAAKDMKSRGGSVNGAAARAQTVWRPEAAEAAAAAATTRPADRVAAPARLSSPSARGRSRSRGRREPHPDWHTVPRRRQGRAPLVTWSVATESSH